MLKNKIKSLLKINVLKKRKSFYRQLIKKNDLCFDIGANIGYKSKLFLSLDAKVVAFEPQSICIEELKKIKNSQFSYVKCGVGSKNETKELHLANHTEVATFSKPFINYFKNETLTWKETETVTVKKLDTLIEEHGLPNYCKIDVEGYEYEILTQLTYEIPIIEFEFTAAFIEETIKCIELLNKNGALYNFNLHEFPKFELKKWVSAKEMTTIFKKLPKDRLHGNIFVKKNIEKQSPLI